jgi:hypothetical protein
VVSIHATLAGGGANYVHASYRARQFQSPPAYAANRMPDRLLARQAGHAPSQPRAHAAGAALSLDGVDAAPAERVAAQQAPRGHKRALEKTVL